MQTSIARVLRGVSLGVWLGAGVMTFITAKYVFGLAPDRNVAGEIMGAILHVGGWLKAGLAVLALLAHLLLGKGEPATRRRRVALIALLLATALAFFATLYLEPTLVGLRAQVGPFTDANKDVPERLLFAKLHGASMGAATLELLFVLLTLTCVL